MGCRSSSPKAEEDAASVAAEKQRKRDAANAAMNAPKLNPADFMLTKLQGQTIVRAPGSINGQQFIIEECEDCTIYLLDHTATVSIDDCRRCRIFVGPCESSVFVRTSKHLQLIVAAQQLRTRECSDLDILLYVSAGQPVIESTTDVRLGCFQFNYFGLAEQFAAAGLDPWYSEWSNVHDFTASSSGGRSWSFIDAATKSTDLLPALDSESVSTLDGFVTPLTWGMRPDPIPTPVRLLVAIAPGKHDVIGFELLEQRLKSLLAPPPTPIDGDPSSAASAGAAAQVFLIRSRRVDLSSKKDRAAQIFMGASRKKYEAFVGHLGEKGAVLGFELACSPAALPEVQSRLAEAAAAHPGQVYVSEPAESKQPLELFFENMAIM